MALDLQKSHWTDNCRDRPVTVGCVLKMVITGKPLSYSNILYYNYILALITCGFAFGMGFSVAE